MDDGNLNYKIGARWGEFFFFFRECYWGKALDGIIKKFE